VSMQNVCKLCHRVVNVVIYVKYFKKHFIFIELACSELDIHVGITLFSVYASRFGLSGALLYNGLPDFKITWFNCVKWMDFKITF